MAREPRFFYKGAIYHVYQRGNNRDFIFEKAHAKNFFLKQLKEYSKQYDYEILAYAVMSNHYHMIIRTHTVTLDKIMFSINNVVAKYLCRTLKRSGHIYSSRYSCVLVKDDIHLVTLLRYIHRNPLKAKLCTDLKSYRWCSHNNYLGYKKGLINRDFILNLLSSNRKEALDKYLYLLSFEDSLSLEEDLRLIDSLHCISNRAIFYNPPESSFVPPTLELILNNLSFSKEIKEHLQMGQREKFLTEYKIRFVKEARYYKFSYKEIAEFLSISPASLYKFSAYHNIV